MIRSVKELSLQQRMLFLRNVRQAKVLNLANRMITKIEQSKVTSSHSKPIQCFASLSSNQSLMTLTSRCTSSLPPNFLSDAALIQDCKVSQNKYELERHGKGESYHPGIDPQVVFTPTSTEAVSSIMKLCVSHNVPIVPFGAGTSVEGHVTPLHGGVSVDLSGMNEIELREGNDFQDFHVKCGPGVTRLQLNEALR